MWQRLRNWWVLRNMTGADKIIEGMRQAVASAKCPHDWQFESAMTWNGQIAVISFCPDCLCRRTEFKALS